MLAPGDGVIGLADAAGAAAEGAELLDEEQRLVPVAPAEIDAPIADELGVRQTLAFGAGRFDRFALRARLARTSRAQVPERQDAVVSIGPHHAERVAADLAQLLDPD